MRNKFDEELNRLNRELIEMGSLCEEVINQVTNALLEGNKDSAKKVMSDDIKIDQKEKDIETLCMRLLLRQQPVARDLRQISSALKMITDMERIGDQAADIAEIVLHADRAETDKLVRIREMASATMKMVRESVDAYVRRDLKLAQSVIQYDDMVDNLFNNIRKELIDYIGHLTDSAVEDGEYAIDLLMIAKYFERIGDHATNIAEWVEFSITGEHVSDKK